MEINYQGLTWVYSIDYFYDDIGQETVSVSIDEVYHENDTEHRFDLSSFIFDSSFATDGSVRFFDKLERYILWQRNNWGME